MLGFLRSGNKRTKIIYWVIIIATVVTFVGGFVFIFGAGLGTENRVRASGAIGRVNGEPVSRVAYQNAIAEQRDAFRRQYGTEPADRDEKAVEMQAWRGLVAQQLMGSEAKAAGLKAGDREVVLSLETSPPAELATNPQFQTDGKFDPAKYSAALRNPNNDWAPFEQAARERLPMRKLQERLIASVKLSEPELREAYRDRYETVDATVLQVPPSTDKVPPPTEADLQRVYEKYKNRFVSGPRAQLEVLMMPKKFSDEDIRQAKQMAEGLVTRARAGEDFASLAKNYSEGAGAEAGGVLNRVFQPSELGPALGQYMMARQVGDISDPYQDNGRFIILKLLERIQDPTSATPSMRVAQIVIKVHPNEGAMATQRADFEKLRDRAARLKNLGKAAAEKGMATSKTGFFDFNGQPPELQAVPEAADWGLDSPVGAVSPVFDGPDEFTIVQVAGRHEAGPMARADIAETVRQLAQVEAGVAKAKPVADRTAQLLAQGKTLEEAATAAGLTPYTVTHLTRAQTDPRLGGAPEVVGALFAAPQGRAVGPIAAVTSWYFVRVDNRIAPSPAKFDSLKGQISTEILQNRQRTAFTGYLMSLREKAKVEDFRASEAH